MPTIETPTPAHNGEQLKRDALTKISAARHLLDKAREDMCNLEGAGYCKHYEKLRDHVLTLEKFESSYRGLKAPTGVFKI